MAICCKRLRISSSSNDTDSLQLLQILPWAFQKLLFCLQYLHQFLHLSNEQLNKLRKKEKAWQLMSCVADADYYILQNIRLVFDRWQLLCVCVLWIQKKSEHYHSTGNLMEGLPQVQRPIEIIYIMKDNLGHYCLNWQTALLAGLYV